MNTVEIAGRKIGPGHPCFIIAEAGVNHNGDMELARQLVSAAVDAGADAVKFQTFKAEHLATADAPKAEYQVRNTGESESQFDMLRRLELTEDDHRQLQEYCSELGILFMSSPFDEQSADLLADLDVPVFKIPSGEITNLPYLAHIAKKGRPMIVSTGMADLGEVESAVRTIRDCGNQSYVLLHCVSNYPSKAEDTNLRAMGTLSTAFGAPVGYSDHTMGAEVAIASIALGACIIEKHLTMDRTLPGPDHTASLEPGDFAGMVRGIRSVETALGHGRKEPAESESSTAQVARKSLVAAVDIRAGQPLTPESVTVKRPGTGLPPAMLSHILGRQARESIPAGSLIALEMLS